jgi:hypothetical protein
MPADPPSPPPFSAPYAPDDRVMAARLLEPAGSGQEAHISHGNGG